MTADEVQDVRRIWEARQARAILDVLIHDVCSGRANEQFIGDCLHEVAQGSSRDQVRSAINRLEQIGLVTAKKFEATIVVELTNRGEEVALGRQQAEGIARLLRE